MENPSAEFHQRAYAKVSSLLILRTQNKLYRSRMKKRSRMIKRRKYLKQHIYENTNIFQLPSSKFNQSSAQNIIWEKNYKLKMAINILKEENSSVKAKLWNIEKENRKMDKQIETWSLQKIFASSNNKPYIDMITVSKVFADQDYEIVSTKIDIASLERILEEKQNEIDRLSAKNREFEKYSSHLNHAVSQAKCDLLKQLEKQSMWHEKEIKFETHLQATMNKLNSQISSKTQVLQFLKKSMEMKSRINNEYRNEVMNLQRELDGFKLVDEEQIDKLKQKMRRIKLEQQNNIKDFKKDLKNLKKNTMNYECSLQEDMSEYIKSKIELGRKINTMINTIRMQLGDIEQCNEKILPQVFQEV